MTEQKRRGGLQSGQARRAKTEGRDLRIRELAGAGHSQREIAYMVGVSRGAVARVLRRAKDLNPYRANGRRGGLRSGQVRRAKTAERDRQIRELNGAGLSQRQIARELGIVRGTVRAVLSRQG